MLTREECLRFADECETMSTIARHEDNRQRLKEMAAAWRTLAAMADPAVTPSPTRKPRRH